MRAPRFDGCRHCGERRIASPVSELLPEQVSPELLHLQVKLAAQLPYRQAAALLEELLPETGGLNYATTRNRTLAVGKRIEEEIREEIDHPRVVPEPAERMVVGLDGSFINRAYSDGRKASVIMARRTYGSIRILSEYCFKIKIDSQ